MGLSQDNLHYMNIDIHQFGFQFGLHFSVWEKSDGRLDRKKKRFDRQKVSILIFPANRVVIIHSHMATMRIEFH